jgi:hypothetical protein
VRHAPKYPWRYLWQYFGNETMFRGWTPDGTPIYLRLVSKPRDLDGTQPLMCSVKLENGKTFAYPRHQRLRGWPLRSGGEAVNWIVEMHEHRHTPSPHELAVGDILPMNDLDPIYLEEESLADPGFVDDLMEQPRVVAQVDVKGGIFFVKTEDGRVWGYDPARPITFPAPYGHKDSLEYSNDISSVKAFGPYVHKETGVETKFAYTPRGRYSRLVAPYDIHHTAAIRKPPSYEQRYEWENWVYRGEPDGEHPSSLKSRRKKASDRYVMRKRKELVTILSPEDRPDFTAEWDDRRWRHFTDGERARVFVRQATNPDTGEKILPEWVRDATVFTTLEAVSAGDREMSDDELRAYIREAQGL